MAAGLNPKFAQRFRSFDLAAVWKAERHASFLKKANYASHRFSLFLGQRQEPNLKLLGAFNLYRRRCKIMLLEALCGQVYKKDAASPHIATAIAGAFLENGAPGGKKLGNLFGGRGLRLEGAG